MVLLMLVLCVFGLVLRQPWSLMLPVAARDLLSLLVFILFAVCTRVGLAYSFPY